MNSQTIAMDRIAAMNMVYQRYSFDYFLDSLDRLHIDHFELWAGAPHFNNFVPTLSDAGKLRRLVEGRGKKIVCVTPEQCLYPHNIAACDKGLRQFSLDYFLRYIDLTAELGVDKMLCCAGWGNYDDPCEESWKRAVESLRTMCRRAEKAGVVLAFEILCPGESNLVNDLATTKRMMDEIREPQLQLCIDTVPIRLSGSTVEAFFAEFGGRICHVHITDGNPTGHLPTGLGEHPVGHYIDVLNQYGYGGFATLEIGSGEWYQKPEEATQISFDTVRTIIQGEG